MAGPSPDGDVHDRQRAIAPTIFRILALQHAELERGRTRAVIVLGTSALSNAFLVGQVLPSGALGLAAFVMFLAIGVTTIFALSLRVEVPVPEDVPAATPTEENGGGEDRGPGPARQPVGLRAVVQRNRAGLERQTLLVQFAITLLVFQIGLSTINVAALR
jgi:hypothetical protein